MIWIEVIMRRWKRLFYYLMINVLVSGCATFAVLVVWDRTHQQTPFDLSFDFLKPRPASTQSLSIGGDVTSPGLPSTTSELPLSPTPPSLPNIAQPVTEYQVQPGDYLGKIAEQFGLTMAELLAANPEITDPNQLEVGQILQIPAQITLTPTATLIPLVETPLPETPGATPLVTPSPVLAEAQVVIENVVGAGDLTSEYILLKRSGAGELSLAGWQLLEEGGNVYTFPQLQLYENGAVRLYTRGGQNTVVELYWGLSTPVWQAGETVVLLDNNGKVRATYRVP
jgi:LysM repeat protein